MKVGIISTSTFTPFGGSEELAVALVNEVIQEGGEAHVLIFDWGMLHHKWAALEINGAVIKKRYRIHYTETYKKILNKVFFKKRSAQQLNRFIQAEKWDFLVLNLGGFTNLEEEMYLRALEGYMGKYVIVDHVSTESHHAPFRLMERMRSVCERAWKIYFVSERLRLNAQRNIGYHFSNSAVVINPVNLSETGILPYPSIENGLCFACVGRLKTAVKGQALLLQILAQEQWKERQWMLNVYGTGEDLQYLQYLSVFFGIQEKVHFHGHVKNIRGEVWGKNHLLLMPSYHEGLPLALVEAMLCGRTAVVSDVGGNAEILENMKTGFIAEAATLTSFSKAMEKMWEHRDHLKDMGQKAYEEAKVYLNSNVNGRGIVQAFKQYVK